VSALACLLLVAAARVQAPEVSVDGPNPAVVKLGGSAVATVSVDASGALSGDLDLLPPEKVPNLLVSVQGPTRQESFVSVRGSIKRTATVSWRVVFLPQTEGVFTHPGLRVRVGSDVIPTRALRVEAVRDVAGSKFAFLEVEIPRESYFVHEPIRVKVRVGLDHSVTSNTIQLQLVAPWLDAMPGTVPMERAASPNSQAIQFPVNEEMAEAARGEPRTRDGRTFDTFVFERAFLPNRVGAIELAAPVLRFRYATRTRPGFFGEREVEAAETAFVYGDARKLAIEPIPEAGRPPSFTGAVGRFRVAAEASPRELRVGESLKLDFRIEGEGNLAFVEPPRLDALEGFHLFGTTEQKTPTRRTITYDLSPLSEQAREVPAIAFSYFDTEKRAFETARTEPIPITVRPLPPGAGLAPLADAADRRAVPGVDDIHDMKPLVGLPPASDASPLDPALVTLLLVSPWAIAGIAWLAVRRRDRDRADPARVRAREAAARFRREIASPSADPASAFAGYLADRLSCSPAAVIAPDLEDRLAARGLDRDLARRAASRLTRAIESRYGGASSATDGLAPLVDEIESAFRAKESAR